MPAIVFSSVVLPVPLPPTMPARSFAVISQSRFSNRSFGPNRLPAPVSCNMKRCECAPGAPVSILAIAENRRFASAILTCLDASERSEQDFAAEIAAVIVFRAVDQGIIPQHVWFQQH